MNSIEKTRGGDYLLSVRHTWSIYKVSHSTGDVLWRLGGKNSDFKQDFNFSWQHDARIVSQNETVTIISFFDNAAVNSPDVNGTEAVSSFKVVALYENEFPMRAKVSPSLS